MTSFVLSVRPERVWLTQDSGVYRDHRQIETTCKQALCPKRHLVIGGAGDYATLRAWQLLIGKPFWLREWLFGVKFSRSADVLDIADAVPAILRRLVRGAAILKHPGELYVLHAGWSREERRCLAFIYHSGDDFAGQRIDRGNVMCPHLVPEAPGYDRVLELWRSAERGREVMRFHREAFEHQRAALAGGHYGHPAGLSETFRTVTVDTHGVHDVIEKWDYSGTSKEKGLRPRCLSPCFSWLPGTGSNRRPSD